MEMLLDRRTLDYLATSGKGGLISWISSIRATDIIVG
jgi:hypothetical protein